MSLHTEYSANRPQPASRRQALLEVLIASTKLGISSFGGPIAHLGYFYDEYVRKRKWMDERGYADLVALSQFLPGPASSQVGIGVGTMRAGWLGGIVAWIGFTLPSAIALVLFAILMRNTNIEHAGWIHGLKIVAVAIVAQAVLGMGQKLAAGKVRATIALASAIIALNWHAAYSQVLVIAVAGIAGYALLRQPTDRQDADSRTPIGARAGAICLLAFFVLLCALPLLQGATSNKWLAMADSFYRTGALVFGGGHVVLPLLQQEVVGPGWVSNADFLAGYGAAQAVPGPLFTFAGYLGAITGGVAGAVVATLSIFLPAYLLIIGALPFWQRLRRAASVQGVLAGVNAAVVGILLASLYDPLFTTAITAPADFSLAALLFLLLVIWKLPPWSVVALGVMIGQLM